MRAENIKEEEEQLTPRHGVPPRIDALKLIASSCAWGIVLCLTFWSFWWFHS